MMDEKQEAQAVPEAASPSTEAPAEVPQEAANEAPSAPPPEPVVQESPVVEVPVLAQPEPDQDMSPPIPQVPCKIGSLWAEFLAWEKKWLGDFKQHNLHVMRDELKQVFDKHK